MQITKLTVTESFLQTQGNKNTRILGGMQIKFLFFMIVFGFMFGSGPSLSALETEDCEDLPEDKQALCKLLAACNDIEDESARQRCYELALSDDESGEEITEQQVNNALNELEELVQETEFSQAEQADSSDAETPEEGESVEPDLEEESKRRGLFGRIARVVSAPVRALLPRDDGKTEDTEDQQEEPTEDEWGATIERTGRIDREVHLVLLDDGRLFEYISEENLRFRKDEGINVIFVKTWLTERYRLEGERGPVRDALLIPCHREDLKGNMLRKCKLMKVL